MLKTCELKKKATAQGTVALNHNVLAVNVINGSTMMPTQGVADDQRIGDSINMSGFKIRFLIGQAADRPNVTFKYWVVRVPKNVVYSYSNWFKAVTNNVLLDDTNEDYVKVLKSGIWKPYKGRMENSSDQFTFTKKLWIPYRKRLNFGPADSATTHDDSDLYVIMGAYDALGTLQSDNIAYFQWWSELFYRDP